MAKIEQQYADDIERQMNTEIGRKAIEAWRAKERQREAQEHAAWLAKWTATDS